MDSSDLLNFAYPEYSKDYDKIVIIADRDKQAIQDDILFKNQLKTAITKGYQIVLTNSCIEFWLLLHHKKEFTEEEKCLLLQGKLPNHKNNVAYELLKTINQEYTKNFKNVDKYISKIKKACSNSKGFCSDLLALAGKLGSTFPISLSVFFNIKCKTAQKEL